MTNNNEANVNLRAGDGGVDEAYRAMSRLMYADRVPRVVEPAPHIRHRPRGEVLDDLGRALVIGLVLGVAVGGAVALLAMVIAKAMGWW